MVNTKSNHPISSRVDNNGNTITRMHSSMKRPRAPIACIRCHHKKVRCDGEHPNCTRCTQGGILCAYPSNRRSRNTQSTSVDPFIDNLSQLEIKIQQIEADLDSQRSFFLSLQVNKTNPTHHTPIYQNSHTAISGTIMEQSFNHTGLDVRRTTAQTHLNKEHKQARKTKTKRSLPHDSASHQNDNRKKLKQCEQIHTPSSAKIKTPTSLSSSSVSSLSSASSSSSPSSASSFPSTHLLPAKITNSNATHYPSTSYSSPDSALTAQSMSQHDLFPTLDPFSCNTMTDWISPTNQNNMATHLLFSDQTHPLPRKHQYDHSPYPVYSNFNPPPPQSFVSQHPSPLVTPDYTNDDHGHSRLLSSSSYPMDDDTTQNQSYPLPAYPHTPASTTLNHTPSSYPVSSSSCSILPQQSPANACHIMDLYNNLTMDDLISFDSQNPTAPIMDNTVWYC